MEILRGLGADVIRWIERKLTPPDERGVVARGHIWEQVEEAGARTVKRGRQEEMQGPESAQVDRGQENG